MSLFGSILSGIGRVVTTAFGIFKVAKPIIEALRPAIPEVDRALDQIEDVVAAGGEKADDFLDNNLDTVLALEAWAGRGEAVMQRLGALAAQLRIASQEQTPDTIDPGEAAAMGEALLELRQLVRSWGEQTEGVLPLVDKSLELPADAKSVDTGASPGD